MNATMSERNAQGRNGRGVRFTFVPKVDVFENADEFLVVADLPGVTKDALNVSWAKGELTLEAQDGERLYRRAFTMPDGIDASQITADLIQGVLTLKLPKAPEVKPRRIQVRAA